MRTDEKKPTSERNAFIYLLEDTEAKILSHIPSAFRIMTSNFSFSRLLPPSNFSVLNKGTKKGMKTLEMAKDIKRLM